MSDAIETLKLVKRMAEMTSLVTAPSRSGMKPHSADFYYFPRWIMAEIDEALASQSDRGADRGS